MPRTLIMPWPRHHKNRRGRHSRRCCHHCSAPFEPRESTGLPPLSRYAGYWAFCRPQRQAQPVELRQLRQLGRQRHGGTGRGSGPAGSRQEAVGIVFSKHVPAFHRAHNAAAPRGRTVGQAVSSRSGVQAAAASSTGGMQRHSCSLRCVQSEAPHQAALHGGMRDAHGSQLCDAPPPVARHPSPAAVMRRRSRAGQPAGPGGLGGEVQHLEDRVPQPEHHLLLCREGQEGHREKMQKGGGSSSRGGVAGACRLAAAADHQEGGPQRSRAGA